MRDLLKDAKYYEELLAEDLKRITRFQEQLKTLKSDNVVGRLACTAFIEDLYLNRIYALYSSGAPICEIQELYPLFLEYFRHSLDETVGYYEVLDALSLGVLLDAKGSLPALKMIVQQTNMRDKLTDTLLHSMDNTWPIVESNDRCAWFMEFLKCAESERGDYLKRYLTKRWYRDHRDASWYNSHKSIENIYVGYWSFEAGAVAKLYGVQDSPEWPYYPYDIVHRIKQALR